MVPLHEVEDWGKVGELMESIKQNGWQGAPLVAWGDQLITGTHRYAAWRKLGYCDYDLPTIDLSEVFAEAGFDIDELHEKYGYPTVDDPEFVDFILELPAEIREKYGIDIH
jgi:hypothetical protein